MSLEVGAFDSGAAGSLSEEDDHFVVFMYDSGSSDSARLFKQFLARLDPDLTDGD